MLLSFLDIGRRIVFVLLVREFARTNVFRLPAFKPKERCAFCSIRLCRVADNTKHWRNKSNSL